jgi:hypothetical protein
MKGILRNSSGNDLYLWSPAPYWPEPDCDIPTVCGPHQRVYEWLEEIGFLRAGVKPISGGSSFTFQQTVQSMGADGAAYANSAAETALATTVTFLGSGTGTVSGGFWVPEKTIGIHFRGIMSTTGTPNWTTNVRQDSTGGTTCGAQTLYATATGIANLPFAVDAYLVCRTDGTAGVVETAIEYTPGTTPGTNTNVRQLARANVTSFDTTANRLFMVTGLWGTANAANTATAKVWVVEVLN